jgi:tryptophanyl-tRNA synthetase
MAKPILVSGIQPTGRLHLGNYLGALQNFVRLQDSGKYECYFIVVDLHSLTIEYDPKEKYSQILDVTADFIAAGLDPKKSVIFQQSLVPTHSELAWILGTVTPIGELRRMTQFKEKSEGEKESANVGLLTYPVLQAADIILYDAKFVPVGEDQIQHLELARTLARRFNSRFGRVFVEPQPLLTENPRVMSLKDPAKKMSKSDPASCLFLDESPEDIRAKIGRATTDSGSEVKYDPEGKPGISNLLRIHAGLSGRNIAKLEKEFAGKNYSYFKSAVAETVIEKLVPYRANKAKLTKNRAKMASVLKAGAAKAAKRANATLARAKKAVGLVV